MLAYIEAIDLLTQALKLLDALDESVAAAHLSTVIDLLEPKVLSGALRPH